MSIKINDPYLDAIPGYQPSMKARADAIKASRDGPQLADEYIDIAIDQIPFQGDPIAMYRAIYRAAFKTGYKAGKL